MSVREIQRLERKIDKQQEVLATLIQWLSSELVSSELGRSNVLTLLNQLPKK